MERLVTVEFGPSRSKRLGRALAEAESGAGECGEVEPGRYRVRFVLAADAAAYTGLARLLERVRHWRATENPPPGMMFEISLGPNLRALLSGEFPPSPDAVLDVPDFVPEGWGELAGEEPPG